MQRFNDKDWHAVWLHERWCICEHTWNRLQWRHRMCVVRDHTRRQSTAIAHDETDCNEDTEHVWFWATKLMIEHSNRFVARAARLLPNYRYFCYTEQLLWYMQHVILNQKRIATYDSQQREDRNMWFSIKRGLNELQNAFQPLIESFKIS